jgi:hypothetical protein
MVVWHVVGHDAVDMLLTLHIADSRLQRFKHHALPPRLGFEKEGYAKDYLLIDGRWQDHVLTALTWREWTSDRSWP